MGTDGALYSRAAKMLTAAVILSLHVLLLHLLLHSRSREQVWRVRMPDAAFVTWLIEPPSKWDHAFTPDVKLKTVSITLAPVKPLRLDYPADDRARAAAAQASFPLLASKQPVDIRDVARLAGVPPGRPLVVVLLVTVSAEGSASEVIVVRSCGVDRVDQAAIGYARLLRWVPGTIDHVPQSLRVILPLTLDPLGTT